MLKHCAGHRKILGCEQLLTC
uniref:Uncharacterized protein n=1 Tax=Arundo donax TaxID=35708 RepID=A0A0A8Z2Q9_ARUDO